MSSDRIMVFDLEPPVSVGIFRGTLYLGSVREKLGVSYTWIVAPVGWEGGRQGILGFIYTRCYEGEEYQQVVPRIDLDPAPVHSPELDVNEPLQHLPKGHPDRFPTIRSATEVILMREVYRRLEVMGGIP